MRLLCALCGGVTVTDDVSTAELARSLLRIETKLDRVTDDHEQRLRRLERLVWIAVGTSMGSGFLSLLDLIKAAHP